MLPRCIICQDKREQHEQLILNCSAQRAGGEEERTRGEREGEEGEEGGAGGWLGVSPAVERHQDRPKQTHHGGGGCCGSRPAGCAVPALSRDEGGGSGFPRRRQSLTHRLCPCLPQVRACAAARACRRLPMLVHACVRHGRHLEAWVSRMLLAGAACSRPTDSACTPPTAPPT